jgi:hypothetical protein
MIRMTMAPSIRMLALITTLALGVSPKDAGAQNRACGSEVQAIEVNEATLHYLECGQGEETASERVGVEEAVERGLVVPLGEHGKAPELQAGERHDRGAKLHQGEALGMLQAVDPRPVRRPYQRSGAHSRRHVDEVKGVRHGVRRRRWRSTTALTRRSVASSRSAARGSRGA